MPTAEAIRVKLKLVSLARQRKPNTFTGSPIDEAMKAQEERNKQFADTSLLGDMGQPASTTAVAPQEPTFTAGASNVEQKIGTQGVDELKYQERASIGNPDDVDALQAGDKPLSRSVDEAATAFGASMAQSATLGMMGKQPKKFQRSIDQSPVSSFTGSMAGYAPSFMASELAIVKAIPKLAGNKAVQRIIRGVISGTGVDTAEQGASGKPYDFGRTLVGAGTGIAGDALLPVIFKQFGSLLSDGTKRIGSMYKNAKTPALQKSIVNNFVKAADGDGIGMTKDEAKMWLDSIDDFEQANAPEVSTKQNVEATSTSSPVADLKALIDENVPKDIENRLAKQRKDTSLPPSSETQAGKSENLPVMETSATPLVEKTSTQPTDAGGTSRLDKSAIEAESVTASVGEGGVPKPEPESLGLNKQQIAEIRKDTGIDELPQAERDKHVAVLERTKTKSLDSKALDIAQEVKDRPRPITSEEHMGMVIKARDLVNERKEVTAAIADAIDKGVEPKELYTIRNRIDDQLDLLTESSDKGGREVARSLNIRRVRLLMESDDIVYHRQDAQSIKGSKLTDDEVVRLEKVVAEKDEALKRLDEANAKWQKDYEELQAKQAEALVRHESNRSKITANIKGKREKIQAERVDILKQLKERGFDTKLNVGLDPQDAFLIGKLGMNYVKGGAANIEEVVRLVLADIPDLTRRDVLQSLNAKNPELQAKAKAAAMVKINQFKKQAELLVKIEDAENGIFTKSTKTTSNQPMEIKALQAKLRELRSLSYQTIRDADRLERVQRKITQVQDQLANHYRSVRKGKAADVEPIASLKNELKDLRRQMKIEDEMAKLEDQLRTGDFEVPDDISPRPKSETLDRAEIDLRRARRVIRDEKEKLRKKSTGEKVLAVSENLRAIKATADLSATLRQGFVSVVSHPVMAAKNFVPSLKATFSQYKAEAIDMAMRTPDKQYLRDKAKLELTNIDGTPTTREEHFAGTLIEKIPGLGKIAKASNRHMATFLNLMRTGMFDDFAKKFPNATTEELTAYARWINVTTGRGDLGKFAQAGRQLGTVFFAPRFAISRIQTPAVFYKSMRSSPRVRAQVAKEAVSVASTAMGILALAELSGAEVGTDPRTSDFGKIRIGNERIDIFAGFQQPMRLIAQTAVGITDRAGLTGKDLRDNDKDFDPVDAWMQFAEFKLSPLVTTPVEILYGKGRVEDVKLTDALIRSVEPMMVNAIIDAWKQEGVGTAVRSGALNFVGVSSNVYPDSETRLRRDIAEARKKGDLETVNRKSNELLKLKDRKKQDKFEAAETE